MRGGIMNKTQTKQSSHSVFVMSIVLAIVLSISYQSVNSVGTPTVQADNMLSQTQSQFGTIRTTVIE